MTRWQTAVLVWRTSARDSRARHQFAAYRAWNRIRDHVPMAMRTKVWEAWEQLVCHGKGPAALDAVAAELTALPVAFVKSRSGET